MVVHHESLSTGKSSKYRQNTTSMRDHSDPLEEINFDQQRYRDRSPRKRAAGVSSSGTARTIVAGCKTPIECKHKHTSPHRRGKAEKNLVTNLFMVVCN